MNFNLVGLYSIRYKADWLDLHSRQTTTGTLNEGGAAVAMLNYREIYLAALTQKQRPATAHINLDDLSHATSSKGCNRKVISTSSKPIRPGIRVLH